MLINLVKNALKFTRGGYVRVIASYDVDEEMFKASVVDNGTGIKDEDKAKLFSQFGKLKRTAAMNDEGIGMGLMICRNLVQLNSGTISVRSEGANLGSIFSFTMKMQLSKDSASDHISKELGGSLLIQKREGVNKKVLKKMSSEVRREQF